MANNNLKPLIGEILTDPIAVKKLGIDGNFKTILEAITYSLAQKAVDGNTKAAEILLRHGVDKSTLSDGKGEGFFSAEKLIVTVVDSHGDPYVSPYIDEIDPETGQFKLVNTRAEETKQLV